MARAFDWAGPIDSPSLRRRCPLSWRIAKQTCGRRSGGGGGRVAKWLLGPPAIGANFFYRVFFGGRVPLLK